MCPNGAIIKVSRGYRGLYKHMLKFSPDLVEFLKHKALWVREETLKMHNIAPETRLASSLSDVEIFVVLYYCKILNYDSRDIQCEQRDRFIVSKGHGAVSLYPILADVGYFEKDELEQICKENSMLGSIPDNVPGLETINGSLGHGPGVGCGIALALKRKKINAKVFVLTGDGELNEGAIWEAIMFASHHKLNNLLLIVDNNGMSMLDYQKNIIDLEPLDEKFKAFNWKVKVVDGHNVEELFVALKDLKEDKSIYPKVLIANTKKGKGVPGLEMTPLCHIKSLRKEEIDDILMSLK